MNFSALSIRHPVPAVLLFVLLTVLGIVGFQRLQIQNLPDMDLPTINISASLEGAAPEQLETEVARKIEDKLTSLRKLDHVTTTITEGSVSIAVSFTIDKDSDEAVDEVRNAVDSARAELPAGMQAPTVSKSTSARSAMLTYTIESSAMDEEELSWFVDNDVTKSMQAVPGVSKVSRFGGVSREIEIELDPALMAGLGVTPSDVSSKLKEMQSDASGGQGDVGSQRQSLRTLGRVQDPTELAAISIPAANGSSVTLGQIASIVDGHAERSSLAYLNGRKVIAFQITRSLGYGDAAVATRRSRQTAGRPR